MRTESGKPPKGEVKVSLFLPTKQCIQPLSDLAKQIQRMIMLPIPPTTTTTTKRPRKEDEEEAEEEQQRPLKVRAVEGEKTQWGLLRKVFLDLADQCSGRNE